MWTRDPGVAVHNPRRHYCARKKKYGMLLMAVCSAERESTCVDLSYAPTSHDSLAWLGSKLGQKVLNGCLPETYYLIGDSAFTCNHSMITPGRDLDFNYELSRLRINVECAFGELVRRWGILWRPLEMHFDKRAAVIGSCCRLYNYCINRRLPLDTELDRYHHSVKTRTGKTVWLPRLDDDGRPVDNLKVNSDWGCDAPSGRQASDPSRRAELEQKVRDAGLRRPRLRTF